ncbi:MAG: SOS response-associated peptidase [Gammaproteobacteria bacterium]|nr:SOS response-associated peptidase [Gammaproteobacteria bacterium]
MCYSAMVQQDMAKLAKQYHADIDLDRYEELFSRRHDGEKLILPRGMEQPFTSHPKSKQEKAIAKLIGEWHTQQIMLREEELFKQSKRLADAERKLKDKETKKTLNDQRIASEKIPWLKDKIKWHKLKKAKDSDYRVFPQHYISMVYTDDAGNRRVGPFRYHLRPAFANEQWDYQRQGAYNARRDSLKKVWKNQFGNKHGIMQIKCFWENVDPNKYKSKPKLSNALKQKDNIILKFEPEDGLWMEVPTIYDIWERKGKPSLYSTALITDDPLEEIQRAGHDRTPVSLNSATARVWLEPQSHSKDELSALLDEIKRPYYEHAIAA